MTILCAVPSPYFTKICLASGMHYFADYDLAYRAVKIHQVWMDSWLFKAMTNDDAIARMLENFIYKYCSARAATERVNAAFTCRIVKWAHVAVLAAACNATQMLSRVRRMVRCGAYRTRLIISWPGATIICVAASNGFDFFAVRSAQRVFTAIVEIANC